MRWLGFVVAGGVVACEPGRFVVKPLPELVVPEEARAIRVPEMVMPVGETMVWEVRWKGFAFARAELVVGEREVHSELRTGRLVSSLAAVAHELTTEIDRGEARAVRARERIEIEGEREDVEVGFAPGRYAIAEHPAREEHEEEGGSATPCGDGRRCGEVPGGNLGHTLHSALGVLRAWAPGATAAGFVFVVHGGALYRIDVEQPRRAPLAGQPALRIDGRIGEAETAREDKSGVISGKSAGGEPPVAFVLWLSAEADAEARPLRVELRAGEHEVVAELIGGSS